MGFNTQNMPALARSAGSQMTPQMLQSLMQTFGNCAQPIVHRGPVTIEPGMAKPQRNGVYGAGFGGGYIPGAPGAPPWDPGPVRPILPGPSEIREIQGPPGRDAGVVEIPGMNLGDWHQHTYLGDQFNFPLSQEFGTFNTFGGPTFHIGGNTYIDNSQHNTVTANNVNATTINNFPAPGTAGSVGSAGPAGTPGAAGLSGSSGEAGLGGLNGGDGRDGAPGPAGSPGGVGPAGPAGVSPEVPPGGVGVFWPPPIPGPPGRDGRNGRDGRPGQDPRFPPPDPRAPIAGFVEIPEYRLNDQCQLERSGNSTIVDVRWI